MCVSVIFPFQHWAWLQSLKCFLPGLQPDNKTKTRDIVLKTVATLTLTLTPGLPLGQESILNSLASRSSSFLRLGSQIHQLSAQLLAISSPPTPPCPHSVPMHSSAMTSPPQGIQLSSVANPVPSILLALPWSHTAWTHRPAWFCSVCL